MVPTVRVDADPRQPNFPSSGKQMIRHQHFAPSPALRPYIKCFHLLEAETVPAASGFERFTPDGCFEVNFNFAGTPTRREASGTERVLETGYTVARTSRCYYMRPAGTMHLLGVRFHPWGLHRFTSVRMEDFSDRVVANMDLFGPEVLDLHERLAEMWDVPNMVAELEHFFIARMHVCAEDQLVIDAALRMEQAKGRMAQQAVLAPYGITQRRFQQRFKQGIGASPKAFSRLMRFQQSVRILTSESRKAASDIAFDGAYYDQAHFVNEFRSFAGISPLRYRAEPHPLNDAAVLNQMNCLTRDDVNLQ